MGGGTRAFKNAGDNIFERSLVSTRVVIKVFLHGYGQKPYINILLMQIYTTSENEDRRTCRTFRQFLKMSDTFWQTVGQNVRRVQRDEKKP